MSTMNEKSGRSDFNFAGPSAVAKAVAGSAAAKAVVSLPSLILDHPAY